MAKKFEGISGILSGDSQQEQTKKKESGIQSSGSDEIKSTSFRIRSTLHKRLKLEAVNQEKKDYQVLETALLEYFERLDKKR